MLVWTLLHGDMMAVFFVIVAAVDLVPVWGLWACLCVASYFQSRCKWAKLVIMLDVCIYAS